MIFSRAPILADETRLAYDVSQPELRLNNHGRRAIDLSYRVHFVNVVEVSAGSPNQKPSPIRRTDGILLVIVLAIGLALALFLTHAVMAHAEYPFDTDEAAHALPAVLMAQELREFDIAGFVREVYGQDFYPPGTAIFLIPAYLIAGPSQTVARLVSVVTMILSLLVMFALARAIDPRRGAAAGLIAVLLTITAQPLLTYAGLSMLEAPGLLASLLLLWSYVRAAKKPAASRLVLSGLLLAAVFLIKYTYGLVALAAIGASELVEWGLSRSRWDFPRRWVWLFGPYLAIMALWFARPGQLGTFFDYTRPLAEEQSWLSLNNLAYYPRSYAIHSAPSAWFALVNGAALLWAAVRWRDTGIRVLWLYFVIGMVAMMVINHPPNPRFIATFVPAAQLLTGLLIIDLWPGRKLINGSQNGWTESSQIQARPRRFAKIAALTVISLLALISWPVVIARYTNYSSLLEARLETSPELAAMTDWVVETVPPGGGVYMINPWDQFDRLQLEWQLATRLGTRPPAVESQVLVPATPELVDDLAAEILGGEAAALVLVEGGPWGAPFWPDYSAGFGDQLREVDRRSFHLEFYDVSGWLDENSIVDTNWEILMAEAHQKMDIGIVVYAIERP